MVREDRADVAHIDEANLGARTFAEVDGLGTVPSRDLEAGMGSREEGRLGSPPRLRDL